MEGEPGDDERKHDWATRRHEQAIWTWPAPVVIGETISLLAFPYADAEFFNSILPRVYLDLRKTQLV